MSLGKESRAQTLQNGGPPAGAAWTGCGGCGGGGAPGQDGLVGEKCEWQPAATSVEGGTVEQAPPQPSAPAGHPGLAAATWAAPFTLSTQWARTF